MYENNALTLNEKKLYLATFAFISGEYEQYFEKAFYAKNEEDIENKIHEYLTNYYGTGNISEIDGNVYYYWNDEVAVKEHACLTVGRDGGKSQALISL